MTKDLSAGQVDSNTQLLLDKIQSAQAGAGAGAVGRQRLQDAYLQVLVTDLELGLDRKLEQELWNIGFKTPINELQTTLRDKRHARRLEAQANLTALLEQATGFYISLFHQLCSLFKLELPCRKRMPFALNLDFDPVHAVATSTIRWPRRGSAVYLCQHCLVHLGDIARYQLSGEQARNYYRWAVVMGPCSGHPYNQLAILETQNGNKLLMIFYYVRAVACKTPFPAATTNLEKVLSKAGKEVLPTAVSARVTELDFISVCLHLTALLYTRSDPMRIRKAVDKLKGMLESDLLFHISSEQLVFITTLFLFTQHRTPSDCRHLHLVRAALLAWTEGLAHAASEVKAGQLPALSLLVRWFDSNPLCSPAPRLAALLTSLSRSVMEKLSVDQVELGLPEEQLLSGFLPLFPAPVKAASLSESAVCACRTVQLLLRARRTAEAAPTGYLQVQVQPQQWLFTTKSAPPKLMSSPPKPQRNVAMQSILAAAAAAAQVQAPAKSPAAQISAPGATSTATPTPSVRQPGLIVSAEIAKTIQEHAAAAAAAAAASAKEDVASPSAPSSISSGSTKGPCSSNGDSSKQQLYNQNRETFQKDLPPRFQRRAEQNRSPQTPPPPPPPSLARKESEPGPNMWFPPPPAPPTAAKDSQQPPAPGMWFPPPPAPPVAAKDSQQPPAPGLWFPSPTFFFNAGDALAPEEFPPPPSRNAWLRGPPPDDFPAAPGHNSWRGAPPSAPGPDNFPSSAPGAGAWRSTAEQGEHMPMGSMWSSPLDGLVRQQARYSPSAGSKNLHRPN